MCGTPFIAESHSQISCSKECSKERILCREAKRKRSFTNNAIAKSQIKKCEGCTITFKIKSSAQQYCTTKCYDKSYKKRNRSRFDKDKSRIAKALNTYNMTHDEFEAFTTKHNGTCNICGVKESGRRHAIDHDHKTGEVRGLLCSGCNTSLGFMKDSPELLRKAAKYLEDHNEKIL